ncbi:cytokine receptor-like factor 2 [Denticeps clupeoides]|uniref:cytokine receptor-like factor 2 n=1 Tax=Denticeps clupeoides TaxID=299321 RepID=UPI0010A2FF78|nr:uncharacterized protein LOC114797130 [Denticeps clupeoides]XP_028847620.1 uncharacterized protein LOC114797130 [Denticeps clupeoides]XP_028847621.1 uncharacterized protein LOC114797130 [Denticeps clupeoides]XP_028847623.1 uncharacterized protein LOC114797130 [Denticeps clupeoides]XP_028847624.1 uncharacterized protein LOC114797130 [Denticeps clupeoides]
MGRSILTRHLLLLLLSPLATFSIRTDYINSDNIKMSINVTGHNTTVTWTNPNKNISGRCYSTELQYRRSCNTHWQEQTFDVMEDFVNVFYLTRGNYLFRLRMKYGCIDKSEWSAWVDQWRNDTEHDACVLQVPVANWSFYYALLALVPVTLVLLFCIIKRICQNNLPVVPDPKHVQEKILNLSQSQGRSFFLYVSQWWDSVSQDNQKYECNTVMIEVVSLTKSGNGEQQTEDEDNYGDLCEPSITTISAYIHWGQSHEWSTEA